MTKVKVRWFGPYPLDSMKTRTVSVEKGIYAIYRTFGGKQTLLYIGKTGRNFNQRMYEHNREWLNNVRGSIHLRLGILECPEGEKYSAKKLNDTESLLIHWHAPLYNSSSIVWYRGRLNLEVENVGRR